MLKKIAIKTAKVLGVLIVLGLVAFTILYLIYNKPLPEGKMGPEAEALAQKMQLAVNKVAWDSTHIVEWTFAGHDYIWDRQRHLVQVKWSKYRVLLNPNTMQGKIYWEEKEQAADPAVFQTAYTNFTNDAFWMNAFVQIYNGNPEHRIVKMPDGGDGLMITYPTGGVTPGDSYLWVLDENGLPKAWQMWVGILPIGGIEVSWSDWMTLPTGAKLPKVRNFGLMEMNISNIKAYQVFEKDIFDVMM